VKDVTALPMPIVAAHNIQPMKAWESKTNIFDVIFMFFLSLLEHLA
jgi:hypothetical protein